MSEHTPGPWKADDRGVITGGHDLCTSICETPIVKWQDRSTYGHKWANGNRDLIAECKANARLIAAAPDLAENQRDVCGRFPVGPLADLNRYTITVTGQSVNQWRKTLAKATK